MNLPKIAYIIIIAIILLVSAYLAVRFFIIRQDKRPSSFPMTEAICQKQGGHWGQMEVMKDTGDILFNQCECPNDGPWIVEGVSKNCF